MTEATSKETLMGARLTLSGGSRPPLPVRRRPRGIIRYIGYDAAGMVQRCQLMDEATDAIYRRLCDFVAMTDDHLPADDAVIRSLCKKPGFWRRAKVKLLAMGAIRIEGEECDERGRVIVPGWIRIDWLREAMDAAERQRHQRSAAGKASVDARMGAAGCDDEEEEDGNGGAPSVDRPGGENPNGAPLLSVDDKNQQQRSVVGVGVEGAGVSLPDGWTVPDAWVAEAQAAREAAGLPSADLWADAARFRTKNAGKTAASWDDWRRMWIGWAKRLGLGKQTTPAQPPPTHTAADGDKAPAPYHPFLSGADYRNWIAPSRVIVGNGTVTVVARSPHARDWIRANFDVALRRSHQADDVCVVTQAEARAEADRRLEKV